MVAAQKKMKNKEGILFHFILNLSGEFPLKYSI